MSRRTIIAFWVRMAHLYGHRWSSVYGANPVIAGDLTDAAKLWGHDLSQFPESSVMSALSRCEQEHPEWPPTVPQFKQLCLGIPTLTQVLDRANDYGPMCAEIRGRMDWYNLTAMPSKEMQREAARQYGLAVQSVSRWFALGFERGQESIEAAA